MLVFSKTAGFRHGSIDESHAAIEELGEENDFQVDHTEDASIFTAAALANYDAVIWPNTTGDVLNAAQQTAFENYIRGGGGYVGLHSAADTEYEWPFYGQLVGAYFRNHPPGTPAADVMVTDPDDHSTQGLPASYNKIDEWYNYQSPVNPVVGGGGTDYNPRNSGVHVLMTVDESDYVEEDGSDGVDDEHPISWCRRIEGGRSWYTGMGHTDESYTEANYLSHILGGIETAAGEDVDSPECGAADPDAPRVQAFADPISGSVPLEVQFSSTAIDPNGVRLPDDAFHWDFGDGNSWFGRQPVHTYRKAGVYTATLTVTDPEGKTGTDTVQVTVNPAGNLLPIVSGIASRASEDDPLTVDFRAVAIDPDGPEDRITYEWDFGEGPAQFGQEVTHTFRTSGVKTVKVTAIDERGGSASRTTTYTIEDPPGNQPPTVRALADPTSGPAPLRVRLTLGAVRHGGREQPRGGVGVRRRRLRRRRGPVPHVHHAGAEDRQGHGHRHRRGERLGDRRDQRHGARRPGRAAELRWRGRRDGEPRAGAAHQEPQGRARGQARPAVHGRVRRRVPRQRDAADRRRRPPAARQRRRAAHRRGRLATARPAARPQRAAQPRLRDAQGEAPQPACDARPEDQDGRRHDDGPQGRRPAAIATDPPGGRLTGGGRRAPTSSTQRLRAVG